MGQRIFLPGWPGPFIFAPNWRGTRYIYDAHADIKLTDASSGEFLGEYHAESSHELIHKSNNPGPIFAAITIIPGLIKGGMSVSPRTKYRQQMYEVAYPNLWKKIAIQIDEDQSAKYFQKKAALESDCGIHLNQVPEVGMFWPDFIYCQTYKYNLLGQEPMESGVVSVYTRDDRYYRIHVSKDRYIIRWFVQKKRK